MSTVCARQHFRKAHHSTSTKIKKHKHPPTILAIKMTGTDGGAGGDIGVSDGGGRLGRRLGEGGGEDGGAGGGVTRSA